jgi:sugar phosphate isomerase/epimerase
VILGVHGIAISLPIGKGSTPYEAVEIAENAGFKRLTIPVKSPAWKIDPLSITNDEIINIKKAIGSGVEATCLGFIWPSDYLMVTTSQEEWNRNLNYANKVSDLARALNVELIIFGAPGRSVPADIPYYEGIRTLTKFWREACKHSEDVGITWLIEQSSKARTSVGNTTKDLIDLVKTVDSPSFQMCAQIHDMAFNDVDVPAAIRASGDMIKMVHVADVVDLNPIVESKTSFLIPGKGNLNFVAIFRALKDIGYKGEVCIEAILGDDPVSDLRECKEFLEEKWKQA